MVIYDYAVCLNSLESFEMKITKATNEDLHLILELQYLAYQSEAELCNNYSIAPLKQTLDELKHEYEYAAFLKAVDKNDVIIGSVRAYAENDTVYIGKLIVHPNHQNQGIGTKLLHEIEKKFPGYRYELFTSSKSIKNIMLYEKLGYVRFREQIVSPGLTFVYMEKITAQSESYRHV